MRLPRRSSRIGGTPRNDKRQWRSYSRFKMFPAGFLPRNTATVIIDKVNMPRFFSGYFPNDGHRTRHGFLYAIDNLIAGGKEQFIVLAAAQGQLQIVRFKVFLKRRMDWQLV